MANLFDYLEWRGDLGFDVSPFNEIDSLILSQISYVNLDGVVSFDPQKSVTLLDAARTYLRAHKGEKAYLGKILPPETLTLMVRAAKTKRFGALSLLGYVSRINLKEELQFSALTFSFRREQYFVAYRGTDDTLVGWKENLNMSFMQSVPAQREAVAYYERIADARTGSFVLCGHSKGGNLAIYAAVKCAEAYRDRIVAVYNNDGPGFDKKFIRSEEYKEMKDRIHTIIPQDSVVGLLLEQEDDYEVIRSHEKGLQQHNAFSWEVLGTRFIHLDAVSEESLQIDSTVHGLIRSLKPVEREKLVDSLYQALVATGAKTLTDLNIEKVKLLKLWGTMDPTTRAHMIRLFSLLVKQTARSKSTYRKYAAKK